MANVTVCPDAQRLAAAAADHVIESAAEAVSARGRFTIALAGGSTPRPVYERLATPTQAEQIDWAAVHLFFGDERCVGPDHPDSNYRMVRKTLIDHVPVAGANVHRIRGELPPHEAADDYERTLRAFFDASAPTFDLVLLGMGADGHTASLFPHAPSLRQRRRWVVADHVEKLDCWRVTLTPAPINAARKVVFVVSGPDKADALHEVLQGPYDPQRLPAQMIRPARGAPLWLVDRAAARKMRK